MQWEESLVAAERLEVRTKQAAYDLSYQLLEGGPGLLADRERWLRRAVAARPPGMTLPGALGRDLFAWKNATYMAQRRVSWDLPSAWGMSMKLQAGTSKYSLYARFCADRDQQRRRASHPTRCVRACVAAACPVRR
jgi:hypothetical protein